MLNKKSKVFLAGHNGMVGNAIYKLLKKQNYKVIVIDKKKLNLLNQKQVYNFLKKKKPSHVIIAAARVGGIFYNMKSKANFIHENLTIQNNLIHGSYLSGVKNLLFLGSSCVYPKHSKQPIKEKYLLGGYLESTNDAYAIAKIAGIKMCEAYSSQYNLNYFTLMPPNLYGPNDNFDYYQSHFFPALIRKIHFAKTYGYKKITLWGDGTPKREILHVDDVAYACIFFLKKKKVNFNLINIGSNIEKTITQYAKFIMSKLKIRLKIKYDKKKPNGVKRKKLDNTLSTKLKWKPKVSLDEGFENVYLDYIKSK